MRRFVGKKNARDEYKVKHANCENEVKNIDPDIVTKVRKSTTPNDGPDYFMHLLSSEIERISGMCEVITISNHFERFN